MSQYNIQEYIDALTKMEEAYLSLATLQKRGGPRIPLEVSQECIFPISIETSIFGELDLQGRVSVLNDMIVAGKSIKSIIESTVFHNQKLLDEAIQDLENSQTDDRLSLAYFLIQYNLRPSDVDFLETLLNKFLQNVVYYESGHNPVTESEEFSYNVTRGTSIEDTVRIIRYLANKGEIAREKALKTLVALQDQRSLFVEEDNGFDWVEEPLCLSSIDNAIATLTPIVGSADNIDQE